MIVTIRHSTETTGMLTKATHYCVTVQAKLSEEEAHVVNKVKLADMTVLKRHASTLTPANMQGDSDFHNLTLGGLLRGDKHGFMTPLGARGYVNELKERLPTVKEIILGNNDITEEEKSETIEV
jgi:hypothetical protein